MPCCVPDACLPCPACLPTCLSSPAVVKKGFVVEQGTHDELLERQGAYHTLVQMQQVQCSLLTACCRVPEEPGCCAGCAAPRCRQLLQNTDGPSVPSCQPTTCSQATGDVTSSDEEGSEEGGYVPGGLQTVPEVPPDAPGRGGSLELASGHQLSPTAQPASPRGWRRPSLGSRPSLGARPSLDAAASEHSDASEQRGGAGGFFSAVKRVPGALVEALPDKELATMAGPRGVMPGMQMQRGVSGIRRYVSFR